MTICIAALCENRSGIVLAADRKVGAGFSEAEFNTSKISQIHDNWWVMMAANDISPVFTMVDKLRIALAGREPTANEIAAQVEEAYREERQSRAETAILSPIGMTLDGFVANGRAQLGDSIFERFQFGISGHGLQVQLIVTGFDADGLAHLMSVSDPGQASRFDNPGFCAIGSGAFNALSFLYYRQQDNTDPLWASIYHVNEAKIFASMAPGVGIWDTELIVLRTGSHRDGCRHTRLRLSTNCGDRKERRGYQRALNRPSRTSSVRSSSICRYLKTSPIRLRSKVTRAKVLPQIRSLFQKCSGGC